MSPGSLNDVASALEDAFSQPDLSPSALSELKQILSAYVSKSRRNDAEAASRLQEELVGVYKNEIEAQPKKLALFMTVLRHLRPAIIAEEDLVGWFNLAVKPFVHQPGAKRTYIEDAQDFVVQSMAYDEEAPDARESARICARLADILLQAYMDRTRPVSTEDQDLPLQLKGQAAQRLQSMLVAFGRKKAKDLFLAIDHHLIVPENRFQALGLLAVFVEQQQAHLYTVVDTAVVEHLLKSLMNDTATIVVSAALRCLIMLLPHIPATVSTQLPRLFLIYSRCLCWEKFSASSTKAQRDLVTDERVRRGSESEGSDDLDVEVDPTWAALHFMPDMPESSAPELLHYFTYLYALYPLNFMSYVRKPRKYLKSIDFPGADDFDLDQAVIRNRTEQFQRLHLLHPSFFNSTTEDELTDNRWLKADPSEVVAECHNLYVGQQVDLGKPRPPPTGKLPALPLLASPSSKLSAGTITSPTGSNHSTSHPTRSGAAASDRGSPPLAPIDDNTLPDASTGDALPVSATVLQDVAQLQRELMLLRNELTFERYLKQQHVTAIAQLRRNHIKAVTIEAETATLINANRALQKKLGDANKFNEKMQKETQARRTHTKQSEEQLTAKIRALKADLTNQESIQRDLDQACKDCEQLRQLLVESEARELGKQEEIESLQAKAQEADKLRSEVSELTKQIRMLESTQHQYETTQAENQMIKQELDSTRLLLNHRSQELERSTRLFQAKIMELETRLEMAESSSLPQKWPEAASELQEALADTHSKLAQTKKAYSQLLDDYTHLKVTHQEVTMTKERLPPMPVRPCESSSPPHEDWSHEGSIKRFSPIDPRLQYYMDRGLEQVDASELQKSYPPSVSSFPGYPPIRPLRPDMYQQRMMNSSPMSQSMSHSGSAVSGDAASHDNTASWAAAHSMLEGDYSPTPPMMVREHSKSAFSLNSEDTTHSSARGDKIKAKSEVRVYGRGGAQNIKMKGKDKADKVEKAAKSGSGFRSLKGIV